MHKHFDEKDALSHVLEKREEGIKEIHGFEMPGHLSAGADSCRDIALFLLVAWTVLSFLNASFHSTLACLAAAGLGWLVWKGGRSSWLAWTRLERLHRLIEQEKYEIEHHRPQEREELTALYHAKGLEGKLLENVIDVLMADQDRLLKIMLEEELGLSLEAYEHPLKQAFGAGIGALISLIICLSSFLIFPQFGIIFASLFMMGAGAFVSAYYEKNRIISAVVWNISLGILVFGMVFFLLKIL